MKQEIIDWQSGGTFSLSETLDRLIDDGKRIVTVIPEVYDRSNIIQCATIIVEVVQAGATYKFNS